MADNLFEGLPPPSQQKPQQEEEVQQQKQCSITATTVCDSSTSSFSSPLPPPNPVLKSALKRPKPTDQIPEGQFYFFRLFLFVFLICF